ncbi:hypothetical protein IFR04_007724 [Cadophora malorum]|uniref:Hydrophobin n=1 Tax=Cadophora malorum TaxID=108018 RepID=A0A8H7WAA7_9HELO|nr:hypothetical protein IFR04_007724 [Cadophora malorum]
MKLPSILSLIALSPVSVLSYRCTTGFTMLCCDMLAYNNPEQTKRLSPIDTSVGGVYISYGCKEPLPKVLCSSGWRPNCCFPLANKDGPQICGSSM